MKLEEQLLSDYKEALKAKDSLRASVVNFLRAELKNVAIAKKKDTLDDAEAVVVIRKQIKSRQDSIEQFTNGGRADLAEKEKNELQVLKGYLPKELAPEEVARIIDEAISATGACGIKDMGKVMKEASAKIAGQADGKMVSDLVKERLSRPSA
jgi:uncharacterized protein